MKHTGIWIDKEKAHIITIDGESAAIETVASTVEKHRPHGGTGTRFKSGPQDIIKDSTFLAHEKQQFKDYFKSIASKLTDIDDLVIFGPAQTNEKFKNEVDKNYSFLSSKIKGVLKADSMTHNQLIAWVRDFFKLN